MIKIENQIISLDVIEKHFVCDLNSCKGSCCVDGDSGAPITNQEKDELLIKMYEIGITTGNIDTVYDLMNQN